MAYFTNGKTAIVTGAAKGIGKATAKRLAAEGARVALVDIDEKAAVETARTLDPGDGSKAFVSRADVSKGEEVENVVAEVLERWGRIDILINCAGIAGRSAPLWEQTDQEWHRLMRINVDGMFYLCRAVVPHMRQRQYGRIVNVASIAGKEGNPNAVPYSTSKAAVIGFTKALAKEVAEDGILVNSVAPAVIQTPILEQVSQEHLEYMLSRIPLGRPGQPEEVAALIAWLSSDECSFSTGACYDISGGRATY